MSNKDHIENSISIIRAIFEKASDRIEAINPGDKIPATKLAEDLAQEIGMKGAQLYPTLLFLFKDYPNRELRRGAHGGIYNPLPVKPVDPPTDK